MSKWTDEVKRLYDPELLNAVRPAALLAVFYKCSIEEAQKILDTDTDEWAEE